MGQDSVQAKTTLQHKQRKRQMVQNSPLEGPLASQILPGNPPLQPPFSLHGTVSAGNGGSYNRSPLSQIVVNYNVVSSSGGNVATKRKQPRLSPFNSVISLGKG